MLRSLLGRALLTVPLLGGCSNDAVSGSEPSTVEIYAGGKNTCVVLDGVEVRCWGNNVQGALGMGVADEPALASPPDGVVLETSVATVTPGKNRSCLLDASHQMRCWGYKPGQLWGEPQNGENFGDDENLLASPAVDLGGDVVSFAHYDLEACAVLTNGDVRCWGFNENGEVGLGHTDPVSNEGPDSVSMVPFIPLGEPATSVAMAREITCVTLQSGSIRCWGEDQSARFGVPGLSPDPGSPTAIVGDDELPNSIDLPQLAGGPVVQVAPGGSHVCALHEGGGVSCWGFVGPALGYGPAFTQWGTELGDDEHPSVAGLVDLGEPAQKVVVGSAHTCALLESGAVKCWGIGNDGILGYGDTLQRGADETPAQYGNVDLGGKAIDIVAGWRHTCALLEDNAVRCWGDGGSGSLGYGDFEDVGDDELPSSRPAIRFGGEL